MKKVGLLFTITFIFFLLGQLFWTIGLINENPLFGSKITEDWVINILFTLCAIFGLIASTLLYQNENKQTNK